MDLFGIGLMFFHFRLKEIFMKILIFVLKSNEPNSISKNVLRDERLMPMTCKLHNPRILDQCGTRLSL